MDQDFLSSKHESKSLVNEVYTNETVSPVVSSFPAPIYQLNSDVREKEGLKKEGENSAGIHLDYSTPPPIDPDQNVVQRVENETTLTETTDSESETDEDNAPTIGRGTTHIDYSETSYDISGTYREIQEQLGTPAEDGSITTNISDYAFENYSDTEMSMDITVSIVKNMPNWTDFPAIQALANNEEEVNRAYYQQIVTVWNNFMSTLNTHEDAHKTIDENLYTNIHTRVIGKTLAQAEAEFDTVQAEATTAHEAFHESDESAVSALTYIQKPAERRAPGDERDSDAVIY